MLSQQLRRAFLQYFKDQGHTVVPSSPVVPHDDPTLLFCNAGMNQFKDVFLGKAQRDYTRAVDSQKCIRVGGKHNDLENVGHTSRHLTFFEMLGNFSFGDYFKAEAIRFAWEVSVDVFGLEVERLWVSVYRDDDEAFDLWTKYLPAERIVRLGEKDNFWAMGDTGPCGPCSELLFDRGDAFGVAPSPYEDIDGERFFEFWNLVFMEFNRDASGKMAPLPKRNIDTGAGLERIVALKEGARTLFETDVLRSLIGTVERVSGKKYGGEAPFHVIADHLRCLAFAIADGVQPSNVDRGYVLRKVLRRAVRYGRQLGMDKPFLADLVPTLIETMGEDFRELVTAQGRIEEVVTLEEESFLRTLRRGGNLLSQVVETAHKADNQISGDDAFKLKDTYGLPLEEILLLAVDADLTVDLERYQRLEEEARERSRAVHKKTAQVAEEQIFADLQPSEFLGYETTEAKGKIVALVVDGERVEVLEAGQEGMLVLDKTPFYAEKGGQAGDTGRLGAFAVDNCIEPFTGIIAHTGTLEEGKLAIGDALEATVDAKRRRRITHNHTATHLLHWALHQVLGEHATQAGSVVAPDRLRFDFSHHKGVTQEEIRQIEDLVNEKIWENRAVESYELPYAEAQKREDIVQFFGDKYGATVRVVDIDYSKELCGGVHVERTGEIGPFVITEERSIAAGIRRIIAVTGPEAIEHMRGLDDLIDDIAAVVKTKRGTVLERVNSLIEENTNLGREIRAAKGAQVKNLAAELEPEKVGEVAVVIAQVDLEPGQLRELADLLAKRLGSCVVLLGAASADRCALVARVTDDLVGRGIKAGDLIKQIAPIVGGGGGGKADFAQAGGKEPKQLTFALAKGRELIEKKC
jgi:alanyl-tRNA synthetase